MLAAFTAAAASAAAAGSAAAPAAAAAARNAWDRLLGIDICASRSAAGG